jgi:hypothetical protein
VEVLPLEGELLICLRWRFDLQPTQKKKIGEPLQKHLEGKRQEGKGNQGCSWSHRGSGHRQYHILDDEESTAQEDQEDDEGSPDERDLSGHRRD